MHVSFQLRFCALILFVLVCQEFFVCSKEQLQLDKNYLLTYSISTHAGINTLPMIEFELVVNTKGWIGIGVNEKREDMLGADLFIGGVNDKDGKEYGNDYHVPEDTSSGIKPVKDERQNWYVVHGEQNETATSLKVVRALETEDWDEDVVIQDKQMYLIWAYNTKSDDPTEKHTDKGSISINFFDVSETPPMSTSAPPIESSASSLSAGVGIGLDRWSSRKF